VPLKSTHKVATQPYRRLQQLIFDRRKEMKSLPDYKDLPPVEGMPHGCAWGLWDKPGQPKDQLGALNLLTPEVVQEAIKEVKTGERCALKYFACECN
jgi:hypothetical protein